MITKITVTKVDQVAFDNIKKAHTALKSSADESKEIHLNINSASGEKEVAIQIAEVLHSDTSIIPVTHASGIMDVSGTVLTACGHEKRRTADPKSQFVINDGEPYGKDSRIEDLDLVDYSVYDALARITGKKFTIFKKMLEGGSFSSVTAKKCGIIDEVTGFKSAFHPQKSLKGRVRKKSGVKAEINDTQTQSEDPEKESESSVAKPVSHSRKSPKNTEKTEGVQRGRIQ